MMWILFLLNLFVVIYVVSIIARMKASEDN
ncbi:MAG: hypothetical protein K0R22_1947 [Sporomusa sp.]|jgi:uncharacterized Tic20 family protein|nr:hypothetical protein [Sporomusa sp.]